MRSQVEEKFCDFLETWVGELEELLRAPVPKEEPHLRGSVSKLTSHFKLYYTVKWAHAHQDVLAFFSPPWLTPLETAHSWVTGWKPSMAFRLLPVPGMSEEQAQKIEKLRVRIKSEEEKVEREMERQQMAMADHHMVRLSRMETLRRNGDGRVQVEALVEAAIGTLLAGLERTMKAADCVRLRTLKAILEVLTPLQCLQFLASVSLTQIRLRQWGRNAAAATKKCQN